LANPGSFSNEEHIHLLTKFNYFSKKQGLEQSTIISIVEDKLDFIWLATPKGIYRFDGQEFKEFNIKNSGLSNDFVTTMLVDTQGELWVGTESGVNKFNAKTERFVQLNHNVLVDEYIWSIFEDDANRVWVGTSSGLYLSDLNDSSFDLLKFTINNSDVDLNDVKTIFQDNNGVMWLSTDRGSNYLINPMLNQIHSLASENNLGIILPNNKINQILSLKDGSLLLIQDKEILRYDNNIISSLYKIKSKDMIQLKRAAIGYDKLLWITSNQGLWRFSIDGARLTLQSNEESGLETFGILYDKNNTLWFGTLQNGLGQHIYQSKLFGHISSVKNSLKDDSVWAIAEGEKNEIWIAGHSTILTRFNLITGAIKRFDSSVDGIKSLLVEKNGNVYIGAHDGLHQYKANKTNLEDNLYISHKLIDFEITYLVTDEDYIYVSSWGKGLYRISKEPSDNVKLERMAVNLNTLPYVTTLKIINKHLYVGTIEGLYIFDLKTGMSKSILFLKGKRISYIYNDESEIYVTTGSHGTYLFDHTLSNLIYHYSHEEITNKTIYSLLKDNDGNIWMSSDDGILKVSSDNIVKKYDMSDGLQGYDFNDNSVLKSESGFLLFGGPKGLNFIDPNKVIKQATTSPKLLFTNLTVFNNSVEINKNIDGNIRLSESILTAPKITLKYSDYPFELTYNVINYPQFNKIIYRYKMNELDGDWLIGKKNRTATYTHLSFGEYTFQVEAIDINSNEVIARNSIQVIILPPLWLSPLALILYTIVFIVFIAITLFFFRQREQSAKEVSRAANRLELSLWGSGDLMWDWDMQTNSVYHSEQWSQFDYEGLTDTSLVKIHPNDHSKVMQRLQEHLAGDSEFFEANYRIKRHSDNEQWVWIVDRAKVVSRSETNKPLRMAGTIRDITLLKDAQERLALQANVMSNISDAIYVLDLGFNIVDVNEAFSQITGLTFEQVKHNKRIFSTYNGGVSDNIQQRLLQGLSWFGEVKAVKPNGDLYEIELQVNTMLDDDNEISHYVAAFSDITQRKRTEEELRNLSNIDPLTKLPNRSYFQHTHRSLIRRQEPHALLMMDVDNFKNVNDSMGHDEGDKLLCLIAERIDSKINRQHLLCRLGGDEFALLLEDVDDISIITQVLYEIEGAMQDPFYLNDEVLVLSCSVGVANYPNDGETTENMLQSADTAMYHAKSETGFSYQLFNSSMNESAVRRLQVESLIRQALTHDWFEVFYQPKIDLKSETLMGMEALVRLVHPEHGMIYPSEFIPIAEDTGLIIAIGEKVLGKACYATQQWRKNGLFKGRLAVNLAAKQFTQTDLLQRIEHILECAQLPFTNLELEITESAVIEDPELAIKTMQKLSTKGIHLALDDFGTGYSSLSYLKRFPINTLKIDKAFIDDLNEERNERHMVASIISIAHNMNVSVVAEGVEEEAQLSVLKDLNCETIQGYFYSKPLSENDFTSYLMKNNHSKTLVI